MPIIAIIIAVVAVVGLGSYFLHQEDVTTTTPTTTVVDTETPVATEPGTAVSTSDIVTYADGVHTASANYVAPNGANHTVNVSLTLANDIVTEATVTYTGDDVPASKQNQAKFSAAYPTLVVGQPLDNIKLSRVGGASLTTGAFNEALAEIKTEATL